MEERWESDKSTLESLLPCAMREDKARAIRFLVEKGLSAGDLPDIIMLIRECEAGLLLAMRIASSTVPVRPRVDFYV